MKVRIRETRPTPGGGNDPVCEKVTVWPDGYPLPDDAEKVPDDTPLSDWKPVETPTDAKKGAKDK